MEFNIRVKVTAELPESLQKVIPIPRSLHRQLKWWFEEENDFQGQPLHPVSHALHLQMYQEKAGRPLKGTQCKGNLVTPRKQAAYKRCVSVTEDGFLALKEFQNVWSNKIILVTTDNTTVGPYINKERTKKFGPLCALLWRILTWCSHTHNTDTDRQTHTHTQRSWARNLLMFSDLTLGPSQGQTMVRWLW